MPSMPSIFPFSGLAVILSTFLPFCFFFLSSPAQCLACYAFDDDDDALCLLLHGDGGSLSLPIFFKACLPCILSYNTSDISDI